MDVKYSLTKTMLIKPFSAIIEETPFLRGG